MPKKPIRQVRVEGNLAYVPLTKGYEAVIDAIDLPLVAGYNWWAYVDRNTVYAVTSSKHPKYGRQARMHRVITSCPQGLHVDHVDLNGLNNRRANLRVATHSQNKHNQPAQRNNTSGFKGVYFHKGSGKYRAMIGVNGRLKSLGLFRTAIQAHEAYKEASIRYHGEFARSS